MRRRIRQRQTGDRTEEDNPMPGRIPHGVYWTVLALVVLGLVFGYDKHVQRTALDHQALGQQYENQQLYDSAISEYQLALDNRRLARKTKAQIALRVANIYFDHYEDYDKAQSFFVRARHESPRSVESPSIQKRMYEAQQRMRGTRLSQGETTSTIIQHVELINQPAGDLDGPILAKFRGREIHAGEVDRYLHNLPNYQAVFTHGDAQQLTQFVEDYLSRALIYRAAIDADLHRNPDVSEKLYDYQRTLLTERYLKDSKRKAQVVTNDRVEAFYRENREKYFVEPARAVIGMVKTTSETAARAALEHLRAGAQFGDVATSYSIDKASMRTRGVVGTVTEKDGFIPGLGAVPDITKKLLQMQRNDITGVTQTPDGAYCIFKVISIWPRREQTLDEARNQIEATLRGKNLDDVTRDLSKNLRETYQAELDRGGIERFWEFSARRARESTSTTATAETVSTTTQEARSR
jgi:tetratricopeptide (TPR) repeat protein